MWDNNEIQNEILRTRLDAVSEKHQAWLRGECDRQAFVDEAFSLWVTIVDMWQRGYRLHRIDATPEHLHAQSPDEPPRGEELPVDPEATAHLHRRIERLERQGWTRRGHHPPCGRERHPA